MRNGIYGLALVGALSAVWLSPAAVADEAAIRAHCQDEWPGDVEMRDYCSTEQRQALRDLGRHSGEIRERCSREWGTDYGMVLHCVEERSAAKKNVEQNYSGPIRKACEREWGTEYEMVEHCIEENGE